MRTNIKDKTRVAIPRECAKGYHGRDARRQKTSECEADQHGHTIEGTGNSGQQIQTTVRKGLRNHRNTTAQLKKYP
jgi:hypothetical protein